MLGVTAAGGGPPGAEIGEGTYRLLFRVLASHPQEVRSFFEDTVAPLVRYDEQYATDLVGTVEAYLANNCNMNATAQAIHAHRHTVALPAGAGARAERPRPAAQRGPRAPRAGPEGLPDHRAVAAALALGRAAQRLGGRRRLDVEQLLPGAVRYDGLHGEALDQSGGPPRRRPA